MSFSSELDEIGLDDIYKNFITIIEWPERLGKKPDRFIQIELINCQKIEEDRHLKISLGVNRMIFIHF